MSRWTDEVDGFYLGPNLEGIMPATSVTGVGNSKSMKFGLEGLVGEGIPLDRFSPPKNQTVGQKEYVLSLYFGQHMIEAFRRAIEHAREVCKK